MGNICRSPLLEGFARDRILAAGWHDEVHLDSAGTGDWHAGSPPDRRAILAAARAGIDISGQRARGLTLDDFRLFDVLLCADRENLVEVVRRVPQGVSPRIELATAWCGVASPEEIPDPYQGSQADFEAVAALAAHCADGLRRRLGRTA